MQPFNAINQLPILNQLNEYQKSAEVAQSIWEIIAPTDLISHSKGVNIKDQILYIGTPHNAVAAKIKLLIPTLLNNLLIHGIEVTAIHVKVQVKSTQPKQPKRQKVLSKQAANSLEALAERLEGSPLSETLSRLAARAK